MSIYWLLASADAANHLAPTRGLSHLDGKSYAALSMPTAKPKQPKLESHQPQARKPCRCSRYSNFID